MSDKKVLEDIERAEKDGQFDDALSKLESLIAANPGDAGLFYRRGRLNWRLGRRGEAMSDYRKAVAIDPESPAAQALEMSHGIMDFYNKDLYNP